jgi:hypothetical protein
MTLSIHGEGSMCVSQAGLRSTARPGQTSLRRRFIQRRNGALNGVLSSAQPRIRCQELTPDRAPVSCNDALTAIRSLETEPALSARSSGLPHAAQSHTSRR